MKKERELKYIEEIKKEPIEERFPIKKELDLKKEVNDALKNLRDNYSITYLCRLLENLKDKNIFEEDIKHLKEAINSIAQTQIILEKIESKI